MTSDCIVEREVQLQAQLFTFLKGAHEDLEPYWYKTVEQCGDIGVSSLPLLLGITDETCWHNFAVAAGIARVRRTTSKKAYRGGFQFKRDVFLQLRHDYKIDTETTLIRRKEWKPCQQLVVQIGSRRSRSDRPHLILKSHMQNPTKSPDFDFKHHQQIRMGREALMSNGTVKTAMETSIELFQLFC